MVIPADIIKQLNQIKEHTQEIEISIPNNEEEISALAVSVIEALREELASLRDSKNLIDAELVNHFGVTPQGKNLDIIQKVYKQLQLLNIDYLESKVNNLEDIKLKLLEEKILKEVEEIESFHQTLENQLLEEIDPIQLPPLSQEQREATGGRSPYYSLTFKRLCEEYHRYGDQWTDEKLQFFFVEGLFQHYVGTTIGYDLNYEYTEASEKAFEPILDFFSLRKVEELDPNHFHLLHHMLCQLKDNIFFKRLGGDFQKGKVILEKLFDRAVSARTPQNEKDHLMRDIYSLDGILEIQQTLLYHWVQDHILQMKTFVKAHDQEELSGLTGETFKPDLPDFFKDPRYRNLLREG